MKQEGYNDRLTEDRVQGHRDQTDKTTQRQGNKVKTRHDRKRKAQDMTRTTDYKVKQEAKDSYHKTRLFTIKDIQNMNTMTST